jgi:hypothetical protein
MQIRLRKISDLRHRLEIVRNDGSREAVELTSRSFLIHDFLHYAVETRAGLEASFWGMLASGKSFKDVHESFAMVRPADRAALLQGEAAVTEAVVGALTGVVQQRDQEGADAEAAIGGLTRLFEAQERALPAWLTVAFVDGVREHMRRLRGEWRAVPFGGEMVIEFAPGAFAPGAFDSGASASSSTDRSRRR